jgi:hypothetical protein
MTKKLISISLIAVAAMMSTAIPSAQGGRYNSYNTSWTMTCSGVPGLNVLGQLKLTTRQGSWSNPAGCLSIDGTTLTDSDTGINPVNTPAAPSSWTWTSTMSGGVKCLDIHSKSPITGKFGQSVFYNCTSSAGNYATGYITVVAPVGQP